MISEKKWALFLLLAIPFYLTWTFDHSLWNPDETRDAGIAAEMYRTSDFVVPKLNGEAFLEKPPLYYWTAAAIYKLTGRVTAGTTRLPSVLYGLLGLLFTFLLGKHLFNARTGFFAATMLASTAQYFRMSHFATMDVTLAALITGALYFYVRGSKVGFAILTILAFYAKGILGVALPGLVVTLDCAFRGKTKDWILTVLISAVLFAVLVTPWVYALWKAGGINYLKILFVDNNWKRFTANGTDHTQSPWYVYFASYPGDFLPWSFFFLLAAWRIGGNWKSAWAQSKLRFVVLWFISIFILLTMSSSKRSIYLLPIFPAGALLSGSLLDGFVEKGLSEVTDKIGFGITSALGWLASFACAGAIYYFRKNIPLCALGLLVAVGGLFVFIKALQNRRLETAVLVLLGSVTMAFASISYSAMPAMDQDKSFVPVIDAATSLSPDLVAGYDWSEMERGVFPFYLGRTVPNFINTEELARYLEQSQGSKIVLLANRNKKTELEPFLRGKMRLEYEYRPNKKTRSYLIYSNRS